MKKKQIFIIVDDSDNMAGESIQSANAALSMLLSSWGTDPCWQECLEVTIFLASGSKHAYFSNLRNENLICDVLFSNSSHSISLVLKKVLMIPSSDNSSYYSPQLIIISRNLAQLNDEKLSRILKKSPVAECLVIDTGTSENAKVTFPCELMRVDDLTPSFANKYLNFDEIKTLTPNRERSEVFANRVKIESKEGNVIAQFELARLYRLGLGVKRNIDEAIKWYLIAAENNYLEAQYQLGELYWIGLAVNRDLQQAITWYKKAAEQGHAGAKFRLGLVSKFNDSRSVSDVSACDWFKQASELGHPEAQTELSKMYVLSRSTRTGKDATKDISI